MLDAKGYSKDEIERARQVLEASPELSVDRISGSTVLVALAERTYNLSLIRGYTQTMIRDLLRECGIEKISVRIVADLISYQQTRLDNTTASILNFSGTK